ncbi:hypothetical protein V8C42DRAFT_308034 [Trichoderma barbatum]
MLPLLHLLVVSLGRFLVVFLFCPHPRLKYAQACRARLTAQIGPDRCTGWCRNRGFFLLLERITAATCSHSTCTHHTRRMCHGTSARVQYRSEADMSRDQRTQAFRV